MSKLTCCKNCTHMKLFCRSYCKKYMHQKALQEANRLMATRARKTKRGTL